MLQYRFILILLIWNWSCNKHYNFRNQRISEIYKLTVLHRLIHLSEDCAHVQFGINNIGHRPGRSHYIWRLGYTFRRFHCRFHVSAYCQLASQPVRAVFFFNFFHLLPEKKAKAKISPIPKRQCNPVISQLGIILVPFYPFQLSVFYFSEFGFFFFLKKKTFCFLLFVVGSLVSSYRLERWED